MLWASHVRAAGAGHGRSIFASILFARSRARGRIKKSSSSSNRTMYPSSPSTSSCPSPSPAQTKLTLASLRPCRWVACNMETMARVLAVREWIKELVEMVVWGRTQVLARAREVARRAVEEEGVKRVVVQEEGRDQVVQWSISRRYGSRWFNSRLEMFILRQWRRYNSRKQA